MQYYHFNIFSLVNILFWSCCLTAQAASSIALGYQPKYQPGFTHFEYSDPKATKGGNLILPGFGSYNTLNPFVLKGLSADGLDQLIFEPLMVQSLDEPFSMYAHIAEDISLAKDKLSVTFRLNPNARFSDGSAILAEDVKFTFDTLKSDKAHPGYGFYYADIKEAVIVSSHVIRFNFVKVNPELHLIVASIKIFSRKWVGDKSFDKVKTEIPIGSGPYIIKKYQFGKSITYVRDSNYWAKNNPERKGMFNFDKIKYKYYRDFTIQLEALKAGQYDFKFVTHSKKWARDYQGTQFGSGKIIKKEIEHKKNEGMQGFVFNTRRELFKDRRVRKALSLAMDFSWSNKNLFYNQYTRCDSYFSNSELASSGLPEGDELRLLNKYKDKLSDDVFTEIWRPVKTDKPGLLRKNLIAASKLLNAAGWYIQDGVLKNNAGKVFEFDVMLAQKGFERILAPYAYNLKKLGITLNYRTVDVSLYTRRTQTFDFDLMVYSYAQSQSPGNELYSFWHSRTANQEGSRNLIGINDPVIDSLIDEVVFSPNRKKLVTAVRALDRVLLHGEYLIPNWYIKVHRIAYWDKFSLPTKLPLYFEAEPWAIAHWWKK